MEHTEIYTVCVGGLFTALLVYRNLYPCLKKLLRRTIIYVTKYLTYQYILHRHTLAGPWSVGSMLAQSVYIALNLFCLSYKVSSVRESAIRAGYLCLANLIPVLLGINLSFLADRLGITLKACHKVHSTFGLVSSGLLLLHVVVIVAERGSFSWQVTQELFAMIVSEGFLTWNVPH